MPGGIHRLAIGQQQPTLGDVRPDALKAARIPLAHARAPSRVLISDAIARMCGARQPCDAVSVTERLDHDTQPQSLGDLAFVAELTDNSAIAANGGA